MNTKLSEMEILQDIRSVATHIKNEALSRDEYENNGKFSSKTVESHFGTWNNAKRRAGLLINKSNNYRKISDDDLLSAIIELTKKINKMPSGNEMSAFGKYSSDVYRKRFGSFPRARSLAYETFGDPLTENANL